MQTVNFNAIEKLDFRTKESYKTLRTNLEFSGRDRKVISVTSCTPNEGKTSVSFQLALSVAEGGKRVVLVDADLRKSVLKGRYKTNASRYGLSHYLSGQASIQDITCRTNIENFFVIFSGPVPPNPSELLGNDAFRLLLEYLRNEYDYVIVDTPPLGSVIDGAVAAQYCDGTVVVIESGAISYKFAQKVKEQLEKV
ncbi:polysaccharide biosynthesis tyrosine autokinase, partial [Eisenbergiella massiliensis]